MKEIIICWSTSNTGKTTIAKQIADTENYYFFNFDSNYWSDKSKFASILENEIANHDKIIIDGWMGELIPYLKEIKQKFNLNIKFYIFFRKFKFLENEWSKKYPKTPFEGIYTIEVTYYYIFNIIKNDFNSNAKFIEIKEDNSICYHDFNDDEPYISKFLYDKDLNEAEIIKSLGQLYHNVEINGRVYCSDGHCNATTTQLKTLNYKDKNVVDLGCYYGSFSFTIEQMGAKTVIGYDTESIIPSTRKIRDLKNSNVKLRILNLDDIENLEIEMRNKDIALLMNVLHHLVTPLKTMDVVFKNIKEQVIIEVALPTGGNDRLNEEGIELGPIVPRAGYGGRGNLQFIPIATIDKIANKYNFVLEKKLLSARPNRTILVYTKVSQ